MQLLIFAGTTEGRELIEALLVKGGCTIFACVATDYGANSAQPSSPPYSDREAGSVRYGGVHPCPFLFFLLLTPPIPTPRKPRKTSTAHPCTHKRPIFAFCVNPKECETDLSTQRRNGGIFFKYGDWKYSAHYWQ